MRHFYCFWISLRTNICFIGISARISLFLSVNFCLLLRRNLDEINLKYEYYLKSTRLNNSSYSVTSLPIIKVSFNLLIYITAMSLNL